MSHCLLVQQASSSPIELAAILVASILMASRTSSDLSDRFSCHMKGCELATLLKQGNCTVSLAVHCRTPV